MCMIDEQYMQMAIDMARLGEGLVAPNPMVGCVVVKDGQVIASGYHARYGGHHAERSALLSITPECAKGATLYVTLEPCCHYGKTPPCTDLICEYGIRRVVIGQLDVNPIVAAKGVEQLRAAGIQVDVGVLETACQTLNEYYRYRFLYQKPFVAQKYAMTLDGKVATHTGSSMWITDEIAREHVQSLRRRYQAILVGSGTVLIDDPKLTYRMDPDMSPVRIVLDRRLRCSQDCYLVKSAQLYRTIWVISDLSAQQAPSKMDAFKARGVEILCLSNKLSDADFWDQLLTQLSKMGIESILIEGGASIHGSVLDHRLAQYIHVYIAPKLTGGEDAPSPIGGRGVQAISDSLLLSDTKVQKLGQDLLIEGYINDQHVCQMKGDMCLVRNKNN